MGDLSSRQVSIAEHLLDKADTCSIFRHEHGHGMPEEVAGTTLVDLGRIDVITVLVASTDLA